MPHIQNVTITPGEYEALKRKADAMDAIMCAIDWRGFSVARAISTDEPIDAADFLVLFMATVAETRPILNLYE